MTYAPKRFEARGDLGRIWRAGLIAALLALVVNGLLRAVTLELVEMSPEFRPFSWPRLALFTTLGMAGATRASKGCDRQPRSAPTRLCGR